MNSPVPYVNNQLTKTTDNAKKLVVDTKDTVVENTNEPVRLAAVAAVVYIAARVNGFKAGYKFAKKANHAIT